jgi:hypothetical protein
MLSATRPLQTGQGGEKKKVRAGEGGKKKKSRQNSRQLGRGKGGRDEL